MTYEMVWEIFNKCSGNQMRDVFIEEIDTEDPAAFVAAKFEGYQISGGENPGDGSFSFDILSDGLVQRMTFTAI